MLFNSGYPCEKLRRIKFGNIELGNTTLGTFRQLSISERKWAEDLLQREEGDDR